MLKLGPVVLAEFGAQVIDGVGAFGQLADGIAQLVDIFKHHHLAAIALRRLLLPLRDRLFLLTMLSLRFCATHK